MGSSQPGVFPQTGTVPGRSDVQEIPRAMAHEGHTQNGQRIVGPCPDSFLVDESANLESPNAISISFSLGHMTSFVMYVSYPLYYHIMQK